MAVRTNYTMPGTAESGLPIQIQRQPYATLAYAADPSGNVTALTGYPSVYPHVININPRRSYDASNYIQNIPAPYAAYNAELMNIVMNGLRRRAAASGGGQGQSVAQTQQKVNTPAAPTEQRPPFVGPPEPTAFQAMFNDIRPTTSTTFIPAPNGTADTSAWVPTMPGMYTSQPANVPLPTPNQSLAQATGVTPVMPEIDSEHLGTGMYAARPGFEQVTPQSDFWGSEVPVENPVQLPTVIQQPVQSLWGDPNFVNNVLSLAQAPEVVQQPVVNYPWNRMRNETITDYLRRLF